MSEPRYKKGDLLLHAAPDAYSWIWEVIEPEELTGGVEGYQFHIRIILSQAPGMWDEETVYAPWDVRYTDSELCSKNPHRSIKWVFNTEGSA